MPENIEFAEVSVDNRPVNIHIVMGEDVAKAGYWSQLAGQVTREDAQLAQRKYCVLTSRWPGSALQRNQAKRQIDAALPGDFKAASCDVLQVGISEKLDPVDRPDRLQPVHAVVELFQSAFDTGELRHRCFLL